MLVEITTSGGTCSLELYPNAVEIGETLYYSGEPYFSHWLARSGGGESPLLPESALEELES